MALPRARAPTSPIFGAPSCVPSLVGRVRLQEVAPEDAVAVERAEEELARALPLLLLKNGIKLVVRDNFKSRRVQEGDLGLPCSTLCPGREAEREREGEEGKLARYM